MAGLWACHALQLRAGGHGVNSILACGLGLVQSSLDSEMCPRFHGVVFVTLPLNIGERADQ